MNWIWKIGQVCKSSRDRTNLGREIQMTISMKLRGVAVLVAVTLVLFGASASFGQVLKGSISGTVVDPQGAIVSGAQVKAKNLETGVVFTTTSDSSGLFRINLIPVGTYSVDVSAQGFKI